MCPSHNTKLINQLRALVLLTQTEEQVARTRISQARTDAVRRELTQNADNAAERSLEITEQLRSLGGRPGRRHPGASAASSAILKATFEQAAPFEEALLDRPAARAPAARPRHLRQGAGRPGQETKVRQLAEKLIDAHEATVEWLTVVLAEEALGGPAALVATPVQKVAGGVARAVNAPVRFWANTVNNAVDTVKQAGEQTSERFTAVAERRLRPDRRRPRDPGRRPRRLAAPRRAGRQPRGQPGRRQGRQDRPRGARRRLRRRAADQELRPLAVADAIKAIKGLKTPHDIHVVIHYEEAHKNRSNVASAAQTQLADLAKEAVGVNS